MSPTFPLKVTPEYLFPDNSLSRPTTVSHSNLHCFLLLKTSHTHNMPSWVLVLTYQTLQQSPSDSSIWGFVITELQRLLLFPAVYNSFGLPKACVFHISPTMANSCYFWLTFLYSYMWLLKFKGRRIDKWVGKWVNGWMDGWKERIAFKHLPTSSISSIDPPSSPRDDLWI